MFYKFERSVHNSPVVISVYKNVIAVGEDNETVGIKRAFGQIDFAVFFFRRFINGSFAKRND